MEIALHENVGLRLFITALSGGIRRLISVPDEPEFVILSLLSQEYKIIDNESTNAAIEIRLNIIL